MAKVTFDPEDEAPFISAIFLGIILLVFGVYLLPLFILGSAIIVLDIFSIGILLLVIVIPIFFLREIFR